MDAISPELVRCIRDGQPLSTLERSSASLGRAFGRAQDVAIQRLAEVALNSDSHVNDQKGPTPLRGARQRKQLGIDVS